MAFVFTVEDGTVVAGANSYVTVAFADDYFAVDPNFLATWTALDAEDKEIYLAWATRIVDQKVRWRGTKTDEDSALRWPRTGAYDRDYILIEDDVIPLQLKELVCEFVKFLQQSDPTVSQEVSQIKREKLDVLEIEYQDGTSQSIYPPLFGQLVAGIGSFPSGAYAFGRIRRA